MMQYYTVEGIDTSGKSTQVELLKQKLSCIKLSQQPKNKDDVIIINEPGSTEFGLCVREMILKKQYNLSERTIFLLFLAQRAEIFAQIKDLPNTIISDRSLISGIAYADFDIMQALEFNLFATQSILPHKIVFLELTEETLQARMAKKQLDFIESKGIAYLLNIQQRFKDIFSHLHTHFDYHIYTLDSLEYKYSSQNKINTTQPQILLLDGGIPRTQLHQYICNFLHFSS